MQPPLGIFFDIDGTLLHVDGAGRLAFSRAIAAVFGWHDAIEYIQFAGATDLAVLHRIAGVHGAVLEPGDFDRLFDRLHLELQATARERRATLFPGVRELVEALTRLPHAHLGLITGNEERCARIKLGLFQLDHHFEFGAYGHEHADRIDIARLADRRLLARLPPGAAPRRHLLGDTPSDIAAARAIGATAIAVATGVFSREALLEAGADHVVESFRDTQAILGLLGI